MDFINNNQTLEEIMSNMTDILVITDESFNIELINSNEKKLLGFDYDFYIGKNISDFNADSKPIELDTENPTECIAKDIDGNLKYVLVITRAIQLDNKDKYLLTLKDITEKKVNASIDK